MHQLLAEGQKRVLQKKIKGVKGSHLYRVATPTSTTTT